MHPFFVADAVSPSAECHSPITLKELYMLTVGEKFPAFELTAVVNL
jgi:hypothetical protein